jgi:DNA-binding IclR family transcriptional regulator
LATAVERLDAVIEIVSSEPNGVTAAQVAGGLKMSRQAAVRLLDSMVGSNMLARDKDTKRYRLTLKFYYWGMKAATRFLPPPSINQEIVSLAEEVHGAAFYLTRDGTLVVGLESTDFKDGRAVTVPYAGRQYHWSDSVFGLTHVAFSSPGEVESLLQQEAARGKHPGEIHRMTANLEEIRREGFAERPEEGARPYLAIAPIFDSTGFAAGLLVAMPRSRSQGDGRELITALLNRATRCSTALGHREVVPVL